MVIELKAEKWGAGIGLMVDNLYRVIIIEIMSVCPM